MNDATLLLRQVHPSFVQNGFVTSQAFRPFPEDKGLLSTYDGDMIDAESSWAHFTIALRAVGTMGILVSECTSEELLARPDPEPFPSHAVVDFNAHSDKKRESKGKKLRDRAAIRGWLYREER